MKRCMMLMVLFVSFCLWPLQMVAQSILLSTMKTQEYPHEWLFSFYLSGATQYRTFTLKDPDRFIVDLKNVHANQHLSYKPLIDTPIKKLRFAPHKDNIFRLVFDLSLPVDVTLTEVRMAKAGEYQLDVRFKKKPHTVAGFDWHSHGAASIKPDLLRELPVTPALDVKKKSPARVTSLS